MTALSAGAKEASSPSLKINGVLRALAVGTTQKVRTDKGVQFNSYGNMTFNAGGVANNGLTYGALAVLQLDRSKPANDRISEAYVYFGSDTIGNIQFGDTNGVSSLMMYDGTDVMGGAGGFDGNLYRQLNLTRGVNLDQNIGFVNNGSNRSTKVTYLAPEGKVPLKAFSSVFLIRQARASMVAATIQMLLMQMATRTWDQILTL